MVCLNHISPSLFTFKHPHYIIFCFCSPDDKDQKKSQKILAELENIDDECDQNDIAFVKIDDDNEAKEWGIDEIPTIVFFERGIPHVYEGDLMKEEELLGWLIHQKRYSEIPEVTDEMKDKLVESTQHLAVIFCKSTSNTHTTVFHSMNFLSYPR